MRRCTTVFVAGGLLLLAACTRTVVVTQGPLPDRRERGSRPPPHTPPEPPSPPPQPPPPPPPARRGETHDPARPAPRSRRVSRMAAGNAPPPAARTPVASLRGHRGHCAHRELDRLPAA